LQSETEQKKPTSVFEILAFGIPLPVSFPNTGGIAVSSYALLADFRVPLLPPSPLRGEDSGEGQELGNWLGD
jgi:hypothetical protein